MSKLGRYIEQSNEKNDTGLFFVDDVKGISIKKMFIPTKADMVDVSLHNYLVIKPKYFSYVTVTSRNGEKISIAFNSTKDTFIVSSSYVSFYVKDENELLPEYLFMYFNRPEFDRYSRFNSWGSARETFSYEDLCDIDINIPSIKKQRQVVGVYLAFIENQKIYEQGLDDLKLVCDAYIEKLRRQIPSESIGRFLELQQDTNFELKYKLFDVMGVSKDKKIIDTKADSTDNDISKFYIVRKNNFVYNPRNGIAIGLSDRYCIISWNNTAFRIKNLNKLYPKYLMLWFIRNEWDRWVKVNSWGSSTEVFPFETLCETKIPIPNMSIQLSIADIYDVYERRKQINEKLKKQTTMICSILVKGSLIR